MFEQQITAGMTLLDEKMPGWIARVNVDTLDLNDSTHCVVGQLTGDFSSEQAMSAFDWATTDHKWREGQLLGFVLPGVVRASANDVESAYAQLTHEWREAIEKRRQEAE